MFLINEFKKVKDQIKKRKGIIKSFFILFVLYMLVTGAIILKDIKYIDDMGRVAYGYRGWNNFSRYMSTGLSSFIHTSSYLADISPLTQIIATVLITFASLIVIIVFTESKKISIWNLIAVMPLGISPYFLECLSYKFDSPYMAISVLTSVIPLLFCDCSPIIYISITLLCTLMTCTTYQAGLGIFPIAIIMLLFLSWKRKKENILKLFLYSLGGYLTGLLIYRLFLMKAVTTYVSSEMYSLMELPKGIVSNIKKYLSNIYTDFDKKWLIFFAVILCLFVVASVFSSKRNKLLTAGLAVITIPFSVCLCFGPYLALKVPSFECRAMFGFGVCMAIYAVVCTNPADESENVQIVRDLVLYISYIACICLSWCFFVFGFVYSNALKEQQRYKDFRTEMVLSALDSVFDYSSDEPVNLQISGSIGVSPILERMPQYQGVLQRLTHAVSFDGSWMWSDYDFFEYYSLNIQPAEGLDNLGLPVLYNGYYETIYGDQHNILIMLKDY